MMKQQCKNEIHENPTNNLRLLDYQSKKLHKDSTQLLNKLSFHHKEIKLILDNYEDLKSALLTDGKKYYNRLFKFRTLVEAFSTKKAKITNKEARHSSCIIKDLQELMQSIEEILTENKAEERMIAEALLQQEVDLWQDCLNLERQIDYWENDSKMGEKINSKRQNKRQSINLSARLGITNNLPAEICDFQNFIDNNGGRTGGWTTEEHSKFLKQLKIYQIQKVKIKNEQAGSDKSINCSQDTSSEIINDHVQMNIPANDATDRTMQNNANMKMTTQDCESLTAFHQEVAKILITKTSEEVARHEKWWEEFQRLETAKRIAIQKWNENRRSNSQNGKGSESQQSCESIEKSHYKPHLKQHFSLSQLEARKAELELWRQQRQKMKKQQELLKKQAEIEFKQTELKLTKRNRPTVYLIHHLFAELHNKISVYKEKKMAEKLTARQWLATQTEAERLIRQRRVKDASHRIQQRTINQLNQLSARKKAKAETEISRQELLGRIPVQTNVHVTRDSERLIQLTKGWEMRLAQPKQDSIIINQGLDLTATPGRMIPQWRRNL
ncbi:unnamed protein product [Heterobilharzia americana]|nr:unnamed protein product [Heterobilharzia americana]